MKQTIQTFRALCVSAGLAMTVLAAGADGPSRLPFPEGYRSWLHVKTATIDPGNKAFATRGGIHHIYANALAVKGYDTGSFPDGSVIVYDELEFTANANQTSSEGKRKRVDVMLKDATRFKDTDGWGYESFMLDARAGALSDTQAKACANCHASQAGHDRVFSLVRP